MGGEFSKLANEEIASEEKALSDVYHHHGSDFPGSNYHPLDRKNWMSGLNPDNIRINQIVWPCTHVSASNNMGVPLISRPIAECQTLSIYEQLNIGTRVLDIRVQKDGLVCHDFLTSYSIDVVINDVKRFLQETQSEIIILEIRTEFGQKDPPGFGKYLEEQLSKYLIHQDDQVFTKTISELLPGRVICIWKPRHTPQPALGGPLWSLDHLRDDWVDTEFPKTKFQSNMSFLSQQPPIEDRKYFYRVENTLTPQMSTGHIWLRPLAGKIKPYGRMFISQCCVRNIENLLQIFSTDFIDEDFVDACVGLTWWRVQREAANPRLVHVQDNELLRRREISGGGMNKRLKGDDHVWKRNGEEN